MQNCHFGIPVGMPRWMCTGQTVYSPDTIVHMYVCTHKVYKYCINVVNLYVILTHISLILNSVLDEFYDFIQFLHYVWMLTSANTEKKRKKKTF